MIHKFIYNLLYILLITGLMVSCGSEDMPDVNSYIDTGSKDANKGGTGNNNGSNTGGGTGGSTGGGTNNQNPQTQPLQITGILFNGTSWTAPSHRLEVGHGQQLFALPFRGINTIIVQFNRLPTHFELGAIDMKDSSSTTIVFSSFEYDLVNSAVILRLADTLSSSWYNLTLFSDFIRDDHGTLDGEWTNPTSFESRVVSSSFPSGNGSQGGNFVLKFGILIGNALASDNLNNRFSSQEDITLVNNHILENKPYERIFDINSDGQVNSVDLNIMATNTGSLAEYP